MAVLTKRKLRGTGFWLAPGLESFDPQGLLEALELPANGQSSVLGGRGCVTHTEVAGLGRVVIKHYTRGGVLGRFIRHVYFRCGPLRSRVEFDLLDQVRALGVNAPEPLAIAVRGMLFYRTWLVIREVPEKQTLADLAQRDEDRAREVMKKLVAQMEILVRNGIYHIDLHPGNVLVQPDDTIFIIDFDKACHFRGRINELRDRYIIRWRRAVIKHALPQSLSEVMSWGLRSIKA